VLATTLVQAVTTEFDQDVMLSKGYERLANLPGYACCEQTYGGS